MLIQGDAATINAAPSAAAAAAAAVESASNVAVFKGGSLLMGPSADASLGSLRAIGARGVSPHCAASDTLC